MYIAPDITACFDNFFFCNLYFVFAGGFQCCFQSSRDGNFFAIHSLLSALQSSKLPYLM